MLLTVVIAGALSIEMGFLGITFASSLKAQPFWLRYTTRLGKAIEARMARPLKARTTR